MATSSQHIDVLLSQLNFQDRNRVKVELINLQRDFAALIPRTGVLTHNDGTIENVLVLGGTIPIYFEGVQYNIPLDLFILQQFPNKPPQIYIRPTSNMTIKRNHRNVDMQGLVFLPYLHSWNSSSSILQLVHTCSSVFSKDPPLFANSTVPQPNANPSRSYQSSMYNSGNNSMASMYANNTLQNGQARPIQSNTSGRVEVPDHLKEKKEALISQITSRLQEEILLQQTRLKADIEQEFRISHDMKLSEASAENYAAELQSKKESMSREKASLGRLEDELESWRASKETAMTSDEVTRQLLQRLQPYDDLSEQLVKLQSEQNAIDDALYYLEKAMRRQSSSVTLDVFLKKTRQLASKQFLCRAHIRKIEGIVKSARTPGGI